MPVSDKQEQRREQARDRQPIAGFQDAEGEPGLGAAGAGDELGNDGADQRKTAADPEAGEKIGQGGRHSQVQQRLPRRRAVQPEQRQEVPVGAVQSDRGVRHDRKERDDPGADQERQKRLAHPDDDQGRDRHDRRHLQDHRIGEEAQLEKARAREQQRDGAAKQCRRGERRQRDAQRDQQRAEQARAVDPQAVGDIAGRRQNVGRYALQSDHDLP